MKLDLFDTHDLFLEFKKNTDLIYEGCMECLKNVPESINFPFYVYAHSRQIGIDEKMAIIEDPTIPFSQKKADERLIWMPRVTKPRASPNSYLFLIVKRPDLVKICWFLPKEELWPMYDKGKMTYNEEILTSIQNYKYARNQLNEPDKDGPNEHEALAFRRIYGEEAHRKKVQRQEKQMMDNLYGMEVNK